MPQEKNNGNEIKKGIEPDINKGRTVTPLVKPKPEATPPPPKDTKKKD